MLDEDGITGEVSVRDRRLAGMQVTEETRTPVSVDTRLSLRESRSQGYDRRISQMYIYDASCGNPAAVRPSLTVVGNGENTGIFGLFFFGGGGGTTNNAEHNRTL